MCFMHKIQSLKNFEKMTDTIFTTSIKSFCQPILPQRENSPSMSCCKLLITYTNRLCRVMKNSPKETYSRKTRIVHKLCFSQESCIEEMKKQMSNNFQQLNDSKSEMIIIIHLAPLLAAFTIYCLVWVSYKIMLVLSQSSA